MIRLTCVVQNYAWGRLGEDSEVAKLAAGCCDDASFKPRPDVPYAELWMGTHSKGLSTIRSSGQKLSDWLADNGKEAQLQYLFKVLSVNQALSVQVHPTLEQAIELHNVDPKNYPDPNHKPEMAIALTQFEMMCGFRPFVEIIAFLDQVPELASLVTAATLESARRTDDDAARRRACLAEVFAQVMRSDETAVRDALHALTSRLTDAKAESLENSPNLAKEKELFLRLAATYPGDIGCFAPFFLNHFTLQPGEASFLGPNEPHAYLSGDCIECMACSDNTIRAGLTPKFKDVETLCKSLTYRMAPEKENRFVPTAHPSEATILVYNPPVSEFTVHRILVGKACQYSLRSLKCVSLLIVISGSAKDETGARLDKGAVCLIPAATRVSVGIESTQFLAFRAFCDAR